MQIEINNLQDINEAAQKFIQEMGDNKVFAFMVIWEPVRPLLSKLFVMSWE